MNKILGVYIFRKLTINILLVLSVLTLIFSFFGFLEELYVIGKENYRLGDAIKFISLQIPNTSFMLSHISILIGSIIALGGMNASKELVIFHVGGISEIRIMKIIIIFCFALTIFFSIFGELFSSYFLNTAKEFKSIKMNNGALNSLDESFWIKRNDKFIFVGKNINGNSFQNIEVFTTLNNQRLDNVSFSDDGGIVGEKLILNNPSIMNISQKDGLFNLFDNPKSNKVNSINLNSDLIKKISIDEKSLTIFELIRQIYFLKESQIAYDIYEIELYTRLLRPFNLLSMLLLAMPILFKKDREVSVANRIFLGILIGLVAHLVSKVSIIVSLKFELNHLLTSIFPVIFLTMLFFFLYRKRSSY